MDICGSVMSRLMGSLGRTKTLYLKELVDTASLALTDAKVLASLLGVHSIRVIKSPGALEAEALWKRDESCHGVWQGNCRG